MDCSDHLQPTIIKPPALQNAQNSTVLHSVKRLCEVQLQDNSSIASLLALMKVFVRPSHTVLNSSTLHKAILIHMDIILNTCLQTIG